MRLATLLAALLGATALQACRQDMHDQPRYEPFEASTSFADGRSARPRVPGTVARGDLIEDELLASGRIGDELVDLFPFEVTRTVLERGRERYQIFCTPCHAVDGTGDGMVVLRGMRRPTSFDARRLRDAPAGYFFDVITRGFGAMYDYSDRIPPADRWAIAAWIRVLQRSRAASFDDVPAEYRQELASK
jgi:mono/diheme cytochrome c family protein